MGTLSGSVFVLFGVRATIGAPAEFMPPLPNSAADTPFPTFSVLLCGWLTPRRAPPPKVPFDLQIEVAA